MTHCATSILSNETPNIFWLPIIAPGSCNLIGLNVPILFFFHAHSRAPKVKMCTIWMQDSCVSRKLWQFGKHWKNKILPVLRSIWDSAIPPSSEKLKLPLRRLNQLSIVFYVDVIVISRWCWAFATMVHLTFLVLVRRWRQYGRRWLEIVRPTQQAGQLRRR